MITNHVASAGRHQAASNPARAGRVRRAAATGEKGAVAGARTRRASRARPMMCYREGTQPTVAERRGWWRFAIVAGAAVGSQASERPPAEPIAHRGARWLYSR